MRALRVAAGLAAGAGAAVVVLRRRNARRDRVELYYEDGSSISLEDRAPESERMLALGREALRAARG